MIVKYVWSKDVIVMLFLSSNFTHKNYSLPQTSFAPYMEKTDSLLLLHVVADSADNLILSL